MASDKSGLIAALHELAGLLALTGANPFRIRAIENGASTLAGLDGEPAAWLESGALKEVKGVGKGITAHVREWVETGALPDLEALRKKIPKGVPALLSLPGLGPKKARQLWEDHGIESVAALEKAAKAGVLDDASGFGHKAAQNILKAINDRETYGERLLFSRSTLAAEEALALLRGEFKSARMEIAGSLRRGMETVKDANFIAAAKDEKAFKKAFEKLQPGLPATLRVVAPEQFGAALVWQTGSVEHNKMLEGIAKTQGLRFDADGLHKGAKLLDTPEEEDFYSALGLPWIAPEIRENAGEIKAAENNKLPDLVELADLRGALHAHTTASDGKSTLREMALAARDLGHEYLAITDHSQTAAYAGGLKPDRLLAQGREIAKLNRELAPFKILRGVESDILGDGSLDYEDDVLAQLDIVVASIHSRMTMPRHEMTKRICAAVEHPATRILAHPSARKLLMRGAIEADWGKVFKTAAKHGVAVEINGDPRRLDLDWRLIREAKAAGCRFAIDPDAHSAASLGNLRWGAAMARKGWLEKKDVVNCMSLKALTAWLEK